ncbi:hypothetical protein RIF29_15552 [Crotalaria pallida]|uniref:Uncharacterized protein n=1 Tax=Crotalaria pallida TaxID=3830 RepID=A0AAN9ICP7_CROPI
MSLFLSFFQVTSLTQKQSTPHAATAGAIRLSPLAPFSLWPLSFSTHDLAVCPHRLAAARHLCPGANQAVVPPLASRRLAAARHLCPSANRATARYLSASLIQEMECFFVPYILRQANFCVDMLAKMGGTIQDRLVRLESAPQCLVPLLNDDAVGRRFLRI